MVPERSFPASGLAAATTTASAPRRAISAASFVSFAMPASTMVDSFAAFAAPNPSAADERRVTFLILSASLLNLALLSVWGQGTGARMPVEAGEPAPRPQRQA